MFGWLVCCYYLSLSGYPHDASTVLPWDDWRALQFDNSIAVGPCLHCEILNWLYGEEVSDTR